jgi:hypothetical protein
MIRIINFIKKKLRKCRDKTSMTNEVKIYAYKLSITEGNIKVEEIEFSVIEKQKIFSLKQEGDNTIRRVVYDLNSPIAEGSIAEKRDSFMFGRRTLMKEELGVVNQFIISNYIDDLIVYYREFSLEKALSVLAKCLEERIRIIPLKENNENLTTKMQDFEKFVADMKGRK